MFPLETSPIPGATVPPPPGLYSATQIPFERYLCLDAFSKSMVKPLLKSPQHLLQSLNRPESSAAMTVGSLTDMLLFEPELFTDKFAVRPDTYKDAKGNVKKWSGNATICKQMLEQLKCSGKDLIASKDYRQAMAYKNAVLAHPIGAEMMTGSPQITIIWDDQESAVRCKARIDSHVGSALYDLKTTIDASLAGFPRQVAKYGYHIQRAMYVDGFLCATERRGFDTYPHMLPFYFVAVEKSATCPVGVYELGEQSYEAGKSAYKRALFLYRDCRKADHWPGYSDFVEPIEIPQWALHEELGDEADDTGF